MFFHYLMPVRYIPDWQLDKNIYTNKQTMLGQPFWHHVYLICKKKCGVNHPDILFPPPIQTSAEVRKRTSPREMEMVTTEDGQPMTDV